MNTDSLPKVRYTYQNHTLDSTRWQHFEPRQGDIIVATSYKSGTTWMLEIVHRLMHLETTPPPNQEYWLDARWGSLNQVMSELAAKAGPRLLKSHLPLDGLPYFPQVKYIVVGRDTRDVFMSIWNHYANYTPRFYALINDTPGRIGEPLPPCPADIHEFWQNWIERGWFPWESEGYPFWGNLHHTQSWWDYRTLDNILFVHFNDLLLDLVGEIRRVAHFLGIAVSETALTSLSQAVTLTAMRRDAEILYPNLGQLWQGGVQTFYFKGTNGRWKEVLSATELQMYEQAKSRVLTPDCARWLEQGHIPYR